MTRCPTPVHAFRPDDRRHRRPGRGRQEHGRARARRAARLPLPRHGRDVPRAHLARAPARPRRSATGRCSASSRARTRSPSTSAGRVFIDGTDVTAAIRQVARRPDGAGRRAPSRGARGDARAAARARRRGRRRDRGPRHRHRRRARRRGEGLPRRRPGGARAAARGRAAGHRRRRARDRPQAARRVRPRRACSRPPTRRRSTRRTSRSTTSSPGSRSSSAPASLA